MVGSWSPSISCTVIGQFAADDISVTTPLCVASPGSLAKHLHLSSRTGHYCSIGMVTDNEDPPTIADDLVVTKYKMAAEITNSE